MKKRNCSTRIVRGLPPRFYTNAKRNILKGTENMEEKITFF
jgi:hypothetical protein